MKNLASLLVLLLVLPSYAIRGMAETRIALVIGNGAYETAPLNDPPNDAALIAQTLRELRFEVEVHTDVSQKGMKELIKAFGRRITQPDAVGLFYYAGHGIQVDGRNYMIPVDADINNESDVDIDAVGVSSVLGKMAYASNKLNILILDACRNNPFERGFRSPQKGLAPIQETEGTLIAYATGPGRVAFEGKGDYSPYTEALIKEMVVPNIAVERTFKRVRIAVKNTTDGQQLPWVSSSLTAEFHFVPKELTSRTFRAHEAFDSIVIDSRSGLMWTRKDNGVDVNYYQAVDMCSMLSPAGISNWRLPTIDELKVLYAPNRNTEFKIMKPFELSFPLVWSTRQNKYVARRFDFGDGNVSHGLVAGTPDPARALCVRYSGE